MNHNMVLYFATGVTISICVLVIGLFGCVTITINTPLPAYQLLVYSNGLFFLLLLPFFYFVVFHSPFLLRLEAFRRYFFFAYIFSVKEQLGHLDYSSSSSPFLSLALSLFFSLFISISSSSSSYFLFLYIFLYAPSRSLLFCPPNEENTYTTLDRLYTYLLFSKASKRYL